MKHTPGPWTVKVDAWKSTTIYAGDRYIAEVSLDYDTAEPNANLIAAAPEMLSALINAASVLACFPGQEPEVQKLRGLIKKARGE